MNKHKKDRIEFIARVQAVVAAQMRPLSVECLYSDDCKTLMSKGHHDPAEFMRACEEWYGGPLQGWGQVRHVWRRSVPDSTGKYKCLILPARPNDRGAYPATCIVDDETYDRTPVTPNAAQDVDLSAMAAKGE